MRRVFTPARMSRHRSGDAMFARIPVARVTMWCRAIPAIHELGRGITSTPSSTTTSISYFGSTALQVDTR